MFRKSRALLAASLCGFMAAVVFFAIGLAQTIRFSRWNPYLKIDWQGVLAAQQPNFAADFLVHSFTGVVAVALLVFLLALGTRTFHLHPTSTVTGVGFLGLATVLMAVYNVWLAFGKDLVLLRYKSTEDEALRQTLEHLYRAGFLDAPVVAALLACFAIPGFALLGIAFRDRHDNWMPVWPWCWLSAAGLLFALLAFGYGYDRTFAVSRFPRTLMIWSYLGLWVLPSITLAILAGWLGRRSSSVAQKTVVEIEPSAAKIA